MKIERKKRDIYIFIYYHPLFRAFSGRIKDFGGCKKNAL